MDDLVDDLIELVGEVKLTVTEHDESEFMLWFCRRISGSRVQDAEEKSHADIH